MSRKILKIGTDVLTLNDKLVSVKEDYPFWKVFVDYNQQFYNKFLFDKREVSQGTPIFYTSLGFGDGSNNNGAVLAENGIDIYTVPRNTTTCYKFNSQTKVITPVFTIAGGDKFSSAITVGRYIFFIPQSHTSIIRLDTETGLTTSIGSFAGANKWGKATLAPNGKIYCPPQGAAQWLIINVNDPLNVTTTLVNAPAGANNLSQFCSEYSNGFVYSFSVGASNNRNMQKMNINTDTVTSSIFLGLINYRAVFNHYGVLYAITSNSGSAILTVDTNNNDSISSITTPIDFGLNGGGGVGWGADNNLYFVASGGSHRKLDMISGAFSTFNQPAIVAPASALSHISCGVITNKFGETFSIPYGGPNGSNPSYFWRINEPTTDELSLNRVLNRNINKT